MKTKYRLDRYNETTALVATKFPGWHPFRGDPGSSWRKLLDPLFGEIMDERQKVITQYSLDAFLSTSTLDAPNTLYSVPFSDDDRIPDPLNLLKNSNFSVGTKIGFLGWLYDSIKYSQVMVESVGKNEAIYCRIDSPLPGSAVIHYVNTTDGVPGTHIIPAVGVTNDLTLAFPSEITKVELTADVSNLEISLWREDSNSPWTRHPDDDVYWLDKDDPSEYNVKSGSIKIYEVSGIHDMFYRAAPTRASVNTTEISGDTPIQSSRTSFQDKIEFHGDVYDSIFDVLNGDIIRTVDDSVTYTYSVFDLDNNGLPVLIDDEFLAIYLTPDAIFSIGRHEVAPVAPSSSSSSSAAPTYEYNLYLISADYTNPDNSELYVIKSIPLGAVAEFDNQTMFLYSRLSDSYSLIASIPDGGGNKLYEVDLNYDYFYVDITGGDYVFRESYDSLTGLNSSSFAYCPYYNHIDQHGLLRGLPRLKFESNYDYKNRLIDYSSVHTANKTAVGLSNGINHRLGLRILDDVIIFNDGYSITKRDEFLYIHGFDDVVTESLIRDTNYESVKLSNEQYQILSVTVDGALWPSALYKADSFSDTIEFNSYPKVPVGAAIDVSYKKYTNIYDLTDISIKTLFETLQTDGYYPDSLYDLTELSKYPALNIMDMNESGTFISLTYYPATIDRIRYDKLSSFQDLSIESFALSRLQELSLDLREQMHDTWSRQILDVDRWDMVPNNNIGGGLLPAYHDGLFSWRIATNGLFYGHVDPILLDTEKQGFSLSEIQSGVNASNTNLELYKDLEVVSFTQDFKPEVKPGFFYIKEMQFYLYADKEIKVLNDASVVQVDLDSIRLANPFVVFDTLVGGTYFWNGDDLYTYDVLEALGGKSIDGIDSITGAPVSIPVAGNVIVGDTFFLDLYSNRGASVCTDIAGGNTELQYSIQPSGLLKVLSPSYTATEYSIAYEKGLPEALSVLDASAQINRGFLYLGLDSAFDESDLSGLNIALINGPGKGRMREIYDPDESMSSGIDFEPGDIIETKTYSGIASPGGPAATPNENLHHNAIGYGHDWSLDFGN